MATKKIASAITAATILSVSNAFGIHTTATAQTDTTQTNTAQTDTTQTITAQAATTATRQIIDEAGVIPESELNNINNALRNAFNDSGIKLYIVFVDAMDTDPETYATNWRTRDNTNNTMVLAVNVVARNAGTSYGSDISDSQARNIREAVTPAFSEQDWAGGATAAAEALTNNGTNAAWLGAAGIAIVGGGAGALIWGRRKTKQTQHATLEQARNIKPNNELELATLDIHILRQLAEEELQSTDHSIRRGEEELTIARAEFGEHRTRQLAQALASSKATLEQAYRLHHRAQNTNLSQAEQHALLVEIVSTCGTADDTLDAQAETYANLRTELLDAPKTLEQLIQQSISMRTRIPRAEQTLTTLAQRIDPTLLTSIKDNPAIAQRELDELETVFEEGRRTTQLPAGQQGALIDIINGIRLVLNQADSQLTAVEKAEEQLHIAQHNLQALIREVEEEITEANQLETSNANINHTALTAAKNAAQQALDNARLRATTDPLGSYTALLAADGELDIHLDEARGKNNDYQRTIDMINRTIADAESHLTAVADTIQNRGKIISTTARSEAAQAHESLQRARQYRETDPKRAFTEARAALNHTTAAEERINNDITKHQQRNSSLNGNDLVTGMVIGSIFSNSGGFGGGFGGGGSFGGFSGGGGGDSFSF